jgi:outer membrane protein OmpA-like peptidoglycan-associated protein
MVRIVRLALVLAMLAGFGAEAQMDMKGAVMDTAGETRGLEGTLKDLGAKVTDQEIVIQLAADVLFDFDKSDIKPAAVDTLTKVAKVLNGMAKAPAAVEGHTDGKGAADYNQKLSDRRANSVKEWLVKQGGVATARLSALGYGMTRPVAPNAKPNGSDDPDGRQKNRRVDIRVKKI